MSSNFYSYIDNYNRLNYKMYPFRVKRSEEAIIRKLAEVENRNSYITELIKNDINPGVLTIKQIKERIKPVMAKHNITVVYLFGSYSRGEANRNSDVDIYCEQGDVKGLWDFAAFCDELEEALGKKVDVVTIGSEMNDFFRQQLEEDMIQLKVCQPLKKS